MKLHRQSGWLFLLIAVLMTVLLLPQPTLAQERQIDLTLRLFSRWSYNEAIAGEDNSFYLEISNIGSRAITGIELSSDKPEGWVIEFMPERIDYLGPGTLQTINVNIKLPENASREQHEVNIIAEANEIRKVEKFWVTVKMAAATSPSFWLWAGIGVIIVVVAGSILVFTRLNKQG